MLISLAQTEIGRDLSRNQATIVDMLDATQPGETIIFGEGALTGYFPEEDDYLNTLRPEMVVDALEKITRVVKARECIGYIGLARFVSPKEKRNSVGIFTPDGKTRYYDKSGLSEIDKRHFTPGNQPAILQQDGTALGVQICREIMDPWRWRDLRNMGADIIVHANNAVYPHDKVWKHLVIARAVENGLYVASVNNGSAPSKLGSYLVSPAGEMLMAIDPQREQYITTEINPSDQPSPYDT